MGKKRSSSSTRKSAAESVARYAFYGSIITAIVSAIAVIVNAYIGYLGVKTQVNAPLYFAQTAEASNATTTPAKIYNNSTITPTLQLPVAIPSQTSIRTTSFSDDFNDPLYDGSFNKTKWLLEEDYKGACSAIQQNGYLEVTHSPSSSDSGCFIQGLPNGVGGNKFQSFEAKMLISNDFQGTCCGFLSLTLASSSFSGGGGWIECALDPEPGKLTSVFGIKHKNDVSEYRRALETTFNNWHTLRLQIDQTTYKVSCFIDNNLIGSTIPKDASILKDASFQRFLQAGWPRNSTGTYQLDDIKTIP